MQISLNNIIVQHHANPNSKKLKELYQEHNIDICLDKIDKNFVKLIESLTKTNTVTAQGVFFQKHNEHFAFIRYKEYGYSPSVLDVHVTNTLIKKNGWLRNGCKIHLEVKVKERKNSVLQLYCHRFLPCEENQHNVKAFHLLTPQYPVRQINLTSSISSRMIDVIAPIGFGQRGLIVAPPKAGKTMMLQSIAGDILDYNKDCQLIWLMIGERPEECTETKRLLDKHQCRDRVEILGSTFDEPANKHAELASVALDISKDIVSRGKDVVVLLDSLTRLTRSYNELSASSGRVMTGGIESKALSLSKRFIGSARDTEEAGSLTIISTVLVDTGMRMDEVIFEEFKGTGNMEIFLSRKFAEREIYPAIDIGRSGTRRADLFLDHNRYERSKLVKKLLNSRNLESQEALELLLKQLQHHPDNNAFFESLNSNLDSNY